MVKIKRRFSFLSFLFVLIFLFLSHQETKGATITIKPGKFDHFAIQIPSTPIAGVSFIVRLQVYDIYNNLITDFNETGKDFEIKATGNAQVEPKVLKASSFRGGSTTLNIRDKKAEAITFSISEIGGTLPVLSKEISIRHNKLDHFILQAPSQVKAGESFDVRVIARDAFENMVVDETGIGKDFKVNIEGTGGIKYVDTGVLNFRGGMATARFLSGKTGEAAIEIYDPFSGGRGKSPEIKIVPAGLGSFRVQAPKEGVAGTPFEVIITALDRYGNTITNYDSTGDGIVLSTTGRGGVSTDRISPSEFKGGNATAKVTYEVAENIEVVATESNKRESGRSGTVRIKPADPDRFLVITPETASAGQSFKLRIEAYDRFKNAIRDYNLIGGDVHIITTGSGTLTPATVPPSEFVNGIAVVDAIYDKAESFSISVKMAPKKEIISIEEKKEKPKPPVEKRVEQVPPKEVVERPKPAPSEIAPKSKPEIKPKPGDKKEIVKKTEVKKTETKVTKKPETKIKEVKKPEVKVAKKPETKEVKKPEPVEVKKQEPKKEVAKKEVPTIYEVSDVGIIESKKRAILIVTSNGPLDHKASLVTKEGKRWVSLKVSPAVRKMEKIQRLKSIFVGDVVIEEEGNALNILLEILPEKVTYESKRAKNTIVVTFILQ